MRYIFVSDIHGRLDRLIKALNAVNFDKDKDTIVNLGDAFDRGSDSRGVLEYLLSCPNRILLWGNHDYRLRELIKGEDYINYADIENGVPQTLKSFTLIGPQAGLDTQIFLFNEEQCYSHVRAELWQYFRECHWALEFKDLIATHAWLPTKKLLVPQPENPDFLKSKNELRDDWREMKDTSEWYEAVWSNSLVLYGEQLLPEKRLLIGHYHAWRFAFNYGETRFNRQSIKEIRYHDVINCDSWTSPDGKLIAIDGCSNWPNGGKVNTFVYESDEEPILY